jgi:hypothetical protein
MLGLLWTHMEHHVCTGFGVSDKTYGSTIDKLLYDIGQGSCASPILWALINQLLLAALGEKFTCIRLVAINSVEEHIRPGDSFVDDTTTGSTNDNPELEPVPSEQAELTTSEESLVAKMEEIIQFFIDLLQVTGCDLAPEKNVIGILLVIDGRMASQNSFKSIVVTEELKSFQDQLIQIQESSGRHPTRDITPWDYSRLTTEHALLTRK